MTHLTGNWVVRLSAKFLDAATMASLVKPTIADLQHEVARAEGDVWASRSARLRGYSAVVRLLFTNSLFWRTPMRRAFTVVSLGWVGAVLSYLFIVRFASGDLALMSPFLLMAIATPIVLRQMNLATTFRAAFVNCLVVGVLMGTTLYSLVVWKASAGWSRPQPWYAFVVTYAFLLACITVGSALAASVASEPPLSAGRLQRTLRHVAAGCLAYALLDGMMRLSFGWAIASALGWAFFLAFYFGCVSLLVYVPILLSARRWIRQPLMLALIGALLCPLPLLVFPALQGRFHSMSALWLKAPASLVWGALPFLFAGAVVGWLVGQRSTQVPSTAP